MKKFMMFMFLITTALLIIGCKKASKNEDNAVTQPPTGQQVTVTPEDPDINHVGEMRSYLTGLWVPEEIGKKRPLAIMFNNYKTVRNQSGIGQAAIVYECLMEGGITRLMGIGENYSGDRFGSVRSARHYFVSIADEYDAIFVHFGKTKYATSKMKELGTDNLDGTTAIGTTVFYRDKSIREPHNAFASLKGIDAGIKKKGYETQYKEGYLPHFSFYDKDTDLDSSTGANKVTLRFSSFIAPYFEYNQKDKLYYRFQFGEIHKDSLTNQQLAFKNIIIQLVKEWDIDRNHYQTMDLTDASGKGYYITNGKTVEITWKKKESDHLMRYYNEAGQELTINPGKTFIALFPNNRTKDVKIDSQP